MTERLDTPQPPADELERRAVAALVAYRAGAPAQFPAPPILRILGASYGRSRPRYWLRATALVAAVLLVIVGPVLLYRARDPDTPSPGSSGRPGGRPDFNSTFRIRLPSIVEPDGAAAPSCPGGDAVFHGGAASIGATRYTIGGHPTMPDHYLPAVQVDLDRDGVDEILTTIACEPNGGRRTVNLYLLKRNSSGYEVLDVPFSDNRRFSEPRPILFSFGVTGKTLALTVDDLDAQPQPPPSKIPDGRPAKPRDVIMDWNGQIFQPRIGDYRW
jgi:hypothetical protein